jgi:hypothetical protein
MSIFNINIYICAFYFIDCKASSYYIFDFMCVCVYIKHLMLLDSSISITQFLQRLTTSNLAKVDQTGGKNFSGDYSQITDLFKVIIIIIIIIILLVFLCTFISVYQILYAPTYISFYWSIVCFLIFNG